MKNLKIKLLNLLKNFSFSGIQNTSRAGVAIPIIYGEIFSGSLVVSAGIDTVQIRGTA